MTFFRKNKRLPTITRSVWFKRLAHVISQTHLYLIVQPIHSFLLHQPPKPSPKTVVLLKTTTQHTPSTPASLNTRTSTITSPTNPRTMDPADGRFICRCGQVFYLYEPLGDDRKWSPTHVHYRSDNTRLVGFGVAVFCWTYMICDYVRWRCSFKA